MRDWEYGTHALECIANEKLLGATVLRAAWNLEIPFPSKLKLTPVSGSQCHFVPLRTSAAVCRPGVHGLKFSSSVLFAVCCNAICSNRIRKMENGKFHSCRF